MATIVFVANYWLWNDITVITYNDAIEKFCNNIGIKLIKVQINTNLSLQGLINHKHYIIHLASKFKNQNFLFCFYGFDFWGLYFIKCLSKKNRIYFRNLDHSYETISYLQGVFNFRMKLKDLILLKILTKLPIELFKISKDRLFIGIRKFKLDNKYTALTLSENKNILCKNKEMVFLKYSLKNVKTIFIDQGAERFKINNELIEILKIYFTKSQMSFKKHPTFKLSNSKLEYFTALPSEMPIEFLFKDNLILIGIASTSFIETTNRMTIISIVHIIDWKDKNEKQKYLNLLPDNVIVPKTIEEFEFELNRLK
jgi:hypothetical protein